MTTQVRRGLAAWLVVLSLTTLAFGCAGGQASDRAATAAADDAGTATDGAATEAAGLATVELAIGGMT